MTRSRSFLLGGAVGALSSVVGIFVAVHLSKTIDAGAVPPARAESGTSALAEMMSAPGLPPMPPIGASAIRAVAPSSSPTSTPTPEPAPPSSAIARIQSAKRDPSDTGTQVLIEGLDSEDPIAVVEAADGLVARNAKAGAAALSKIDIRRNGAIAPSVIDSLGKMAAADPTVRRTAVERLLALLAQEKRRSAPESAANLLQIYEALGEARGPEAAPTLEAELLDGSVDTAAKVVIVRALGQLGAATSQGALARARAALFDPHARARAGESDAFEEDLRKELAAAIDAVLR